MKNKTETNQRVIERTILDAVKTFILRSLACIYMFQLAMANK